MLKLISELDEIGFEVIHNSDSKAVICSTKITNMYGTYTLKNLVSVPFSHIYQQLSFHLI